MSDTKPPDIELLRGWIGRTETMRDTLTARLAQALTATLGGSDAIPEPGTPAPYAAHWCLAPPIVTATGLGPDGHPARGGFLPPVPLPRRMWAGGDLQFHDRLLVEDMVERRSRIADVTLKTGRTGTLCFVTVAHEIFTPRGLAVTERQDVVYREAAQPTGSTPPRYDGPAPEWRQQVTANSIALFRYSAITFNGHRIHYDREYAISQEFYPGLVVHGPLQATLLLGFAAGILGRHPDHLSFRGLSPLFDFQNFTLAARREGEKLQLWVQNEDAVQTMTAEAS